MGVYSYILGKAVLSDAHRQELKQKRGFTDETIDTNKFFSGGKYLLDFEQELIGKFTKDELIDSGVCIDSGKGPTITPILLEERIVIPYLKTDGSCSLLRPHKLGLSKIPVQIYQERNLSESCKSIILTEGEFKAAAACQLGFPALAVPGISSFSKDNFPGLVKTLNVHGVRQIWIIFDNEIKDDVRFKDRYKEDPSARHDTTYYAYFMAKELEREGFNTRVSVLPDGWRVNGKIDIDGALAQGRTREDLLQVVNSGKTWREFMEDVSDEARAVIKRKEAKRFFRSHVRKEFGRYVAVRKFGKTEIDDVISNFTLKISSTIQTPEGMIRLVQFTNEFNESVSFSHLKPEEMSSDSFRTFCFAKGNFLWTGKQEDLMNIWRGEFLEDSGRFIVEPDHVGWLDDEKMWLFGNLALNKDGQEMRPDENGIFWLEKKGIKPVPLVRGADFETIPHLSFNKIDIQDVKRRLIDTVGEMEAKICLGWAGAVPFMAEVFATYECFPFLYLVGKRRMGKSTVAKWLVRMLGIDASDKMASDTTAVAMQRYMAYYSGLPMFIDEYRNVKNVTSKDGFLRSAYNRQAAGKGIKLDFGVREGKVRGTLIIAGEETPNDSALMDRCVFVQIGNRNKDNNHFEWFTQHKSRLSYFSYDILRNKLKLRDRFLAVAKEAKDFFVSCRTDDRIAVHYAVVAAGYAAVYGENDLDFARWIAQEAKATQDITETRHAVSQFFDDLQAMAIRPEWGLGENYWRIEDGRVYFYFQGLYNLWAEDYRRRKGEPPFNDISIRNYLKAENGWLQSGLSFRIGKSRRSCVVFDIEKAPEGLRNLIGADEILSELALGQSESKGDALGQG